MKSHQQPVKERDSAYEAFCKNIAMEPVKQQTEVMHFSSMQALAEQRFEERMTAALQVLFDFVNQEERTIHRVDKSLLDQYIAKIDAYLNQQLDAILHHPDFQALESIWRSLFYLVDKTDPKSNVKLELLSVSPEELARDFEETSDITQSFLYQQVYTEEYDTPGGEPFAAMISDFAFNASHQDLELLKNIAKVSASSHCPLIASPTCEFFGKKNFQEILDIEDLTNYFERAEYIKWRTFRESDESSYIGLTLPKFLLRMPYGLDNPVKNFFYQESTQDLVKHADAYLWGNASFAFAVNMIKSFEEYGWCVNIRGPESGGRVDNLPLHQYQATHGLQTKIPIEVCIPETNELELANLGFIPLSYYKNSDFACFFSANAVKKPSLFMDKEANANSRINAKLPYLFLISRLAHYLKVLQRENIGANKTRQELERELNGWLQTLVTKMNSPGPEIIATHPLREGFVTVENNLENPGFYKVNLFAMPHFQIEGVDVRLSLVGQLPSKEKS